MHCCVSHLLLKLFLFLYHFIMILYVFIFFFTSISLCLNSAKDSLSPLTVPLLLTRA